MVDETLPITISYADSTKAPSSNITLEPRRVDHNSAPIALIGPNARYYGQFVAQNLLYILENFASSTEPENVVEGMLWYDLVEDTLKYAFELSQYEFEVPANPPQNPNPIPERIATYRFKEVGTPAVTSFRPAVGDVLWYEPDTNVVSIPSEDDSVWLPVGLNYLPLTGSVDISLNSIRQDTTFPVNVTVNTGSSFGDGDIDVYGTFYNNLDLRVEESVHVPGETVIGSSSFLNFNYVNDDLAALGASTSLLLSGSNFNFYAGTECEMRAGTNYLEFKDHVTKFRGSTTIGTNQINFNNRKAKNGHIVSVAIADRVAILDEAITYEELQDMVVTFNLGGESGDPEISTGGGSMDSGADLVAVGTTSMSLSGSRDSDTQPPGFSFEGGSKGALLCELDSSDYGYQNMWGGLAVFPKVNGNYSGYIYDDNVSLAMLQGTSTISLNMGDKGVAKNVPTPTLPYHPCNKGYIDTEVARVAAILAQRQDGRAKATVKLRLGRVGETIKIIDDGSFNVRVRQDLAIGSDAGHPWITEPAVSTPNSYSGFHTNWITTTAGGPNFEPSDEVYAQYTVFLNEATENGFTHPPGYIPKIGTIISSQMVNHTNEKGHYNFDDDSLSAFNVSTRTSTEDGVPVVIIRICISYNMVILEKTNPVGIAWQQWRKRLPYNYSKLVHNGHNENKMLPKEYYLFNEGPKKTYLFEYGVEHWRNHRNYYHHNYPLSGNYAQYFPGPASGSYGKIFIELQKRNQGNVRLILNMNDALPQHPGYHPDGYNTGITYLELVRTLNQAVLNAAQHPTLLPSNLPGDPMPVLADDLIWRFNLHGEQPAIECVYVGETPEDTHMRVYDAPGDEFWSPNESVKTISNGVTYITHKRGYYSRETPYGDALLPRPPERHIEAAFFWK